MLPFFIGFLLATPPSPVLSVPVPLLAIEAPSAPLPPTDEIACNCYLFVKQLLPNLPNTKYLIPNSPAQAGAVAIYLYPGNLPHYAYVTSVENDPVYGHWEDGSNLKHCTYYHRFVREDNPYLVGYWYPSWIASAPTQNLATEKVRTGMSATSVASQ